MEDSPGDQLFCGVDVGASSTKLVLLDKDSEVRSRAIRLKGADVALSRLEGVMSRGDRRLAPVIERAWRAGCRFDGWSEHFSFDQWARAADSALSGSGVDVDWFTTRERAHDEVLPWDHLESGVSRAYLEREYRRAAEARPTVDCRTDNCQVCGLQDSVSACAARLQSPNRPQSPA